MCGVRHQQVSEYHLEFVTAASTRTFKAKTKATFNKIYKSDCPLKLQDCRKAWSHGRHVIQVCFCLSRRPRGHTLETAGKDLCRRLFAAENRGAIAELTEESILGVSASCKEWRRWFHEALFSSGLVQGPDFLRYLNKQASKSDCFQKWLLVYSYAVFAYLDLALLAIGVATKAEAAASILLASDSADLLERYIQVNRKHERWIQSTWESSAGAFNKGCAETIKAIKDYAAHGKSGTELRDKLFDLAQRCAELTTSNEAVLKKMKDARAASMQKLVFRAGSVAGALAIISSTITTSTIVTSVGVAPLSTWFLSGPLLVETATILGCAAPPVAIAVAAVGVWQWTKMEEERHRLEIVNKNVAYCEQLKSLTVAVWSVVAETDAVLVWARCTHMRVPHRHRPAEIGVEGSMDGTREAMARQRIHEFVRSCRGHGGEAEIPRDARARRAIVQQYIGERRNELKRMQQDLAKAEDAVRASLTPPTK